MTYPLRKLKPAAKPVESLSARVYHEIKGLILRNEIMPGQKLHHQELSERLGVSRTPVREALTRLVQEGYASLLPNRGFICKEIRLQEAEELYDLREALEAFAVEKAIEKLSLGSLAELEQKVELYGRDIHKRFTRERLIYDQNIHLEIAQIAGNETLKRSLQQVFERIILKRKTDGLYDLSRAVSAHQEHVAIAQAIKRRDVSAAVQIVRGHIQEGKKNVLRDLQARNEIRDFQIQTES
ncbi:MAG: GntR family transcriptional regulator [Deltaproteobacteria bacterium]|nr:GntR family transcriptional regulator [Deltaproteobacteria bacterium]